MLLKRHYKTPEDWVKQVDASGRCINPPPIDHIEVKHTGSSQRQHFSDRLVLAGLREGWISLKDRLLTLHAKPKDLHYKVLRTPGKYPTEAAPGYEVIHYYECLLDKAQHEEFRAGKAAV